MQNVESIYQQSIKPLPLKEQLRLADLIRERAGVAPVARKSALEILRTIQPAQARRTAAEINAYLRTERDSWDD